MRLNAVIALNYKSSDLSVITDNLNRAGFPIDTLQVINKEGIAAAMNLGIKLCGEHQFYTFLSNDIVEPDNWLKIRNNFMEDETGMCSFPIDPPAHYNDQDIIGNLTISNELYKKIGAFNYYFDPYGPIDLDYCIRARLAGFKTKYIEGYFSLHPLEHASGNKYGYDKAKLVEEKWGDHVKNIAAYSDGNKDLFIENDYTIFMQQWPNINT